MGIKWYFSTIVQANRTNTIQRLTLGPPYSTSGIAPASSGVDAGASAVFPNCSQILTALQKMFQLGNHAVCHIEGNPGVTSRAATFQNVAAAPANHPLRLSTFLAGSGYQSTSQSLGSVGGNAAASMLDGPGDLFGVRSVLDLMFLVVFESPDVLQV